MWVIVNRFYPSIIRRESCSLIFSGFRLLLITTNDLLPNYYEISFFLQFKCDHSKLEEFCRKYCCWRNSSILINLFSIASDFMGTNALWYNISSRRNVVYEDTLINLSYKHLNAIGSYADAAESKRDCCRRWKFQLNSD